MIGSKFVLATDAFKIRQHGTNEKEKKKEIRIFTLMLFRSKTYRIIEVEIEKYGISRHESPDKCMHINVIF